MMASLRPRLTAIALLLPAVSARHVRSLTPLSQLSSMPVIQRRTCAIVARGGRGRKRRDKGPPREPRTLQHSLDGQPPEIARTYPEQYDELLSTKVGLLETLLTDATGGGPLPPMEVFESQRENFRMRASFATWREEEKIYYIMFNKDDERRMPHAVPSYPMGSKRINELMPLVLAAVETDPALNQRIADIRFVTTLLGDALVVMTYNRPIDKDSSWEDAAYKLAEVLGLGPAMQPVKIVGRSRKVKIVVNGETVQEKLTVGGGRGECTYTQTEGAFSQPNAGVCEQMLTWAFDATRGLGDTDLCELYCGNSCFTVALAPQFRKVVATELSKASVDLARQNLHANAVENVNVAKMSAEEFVQAYDGMHFNRLDEAGIDMRESKPLMKTLFVDPPRAGLDQTCRTLAQQFERVVYISCNPETLARDVAELSATHAVRRIAAFDQFPYTPHLEAGVLLERR